MGALPGRQCGQACGFPLSICKPLLTSLRSVSGPYLVHEALKQQQSRGLTTGRALGNVLISSSQSFKSGTATVAIRMRTLRHKSWETCLR